MKSIKTSLIAVAIAASAVSASAQSGPAVYNRLLVEENLNLQEQLAAFNQTINDLENNNSDLIAGLDEARGWASGNETAAKNEKLAFNKIKANLAIQLALAKAANIEADQDEAVANQDEAVADDGSVTVYQAKEDIASVNTLTQRFVNKTQEVTLELADNGISFTASLGDNLVLQYGIVNETEMGLIVSKGERVIAEQTFSLSSDNSDLRGLGFAHGNNYYVLAVKDASYTQLDVAKLLEAEEVTVALLKDEQVFMHEGEITKTAEVSIEAVYHGFDIPVVEVAEEEADSEEDEDEDEAAEEEVETASAPVKVGNLFNKIF